MAVFQYAPEVLDRFPSVVGGVILASGVTSGPAPPALAEAFTREQAKVRSRIGETPLSEVPSLAAWRRVFRGFGVDPTQYRSAAEALLRRLVKQGDVPSIGRLVDVANLVSIRHALPVAVFDVAAVGGAIEVRFASGDEPWGDLGSSTTEHPEAGEVIFVDAGGRTVARRWCWRQSLSSAASDATRDVLVTVEGHHESAATDVAAAVDDLEALLGTHATPTTVRHAVLDPATPSFDGAST